MKKFTALITPAIKKGGISMKKFTALITSAILAVTSLCTTTISADAEVYAPVTLEELITNYRVVDDYEIRTIEECGKFINNDDRLIALHKTKLNITNIKVKDVTKYSEIFAKYDEMLAFDNVEVSEGNGFTLYKYHDNLDSENVIIENEKRDLIAEMCAEMKEADAIYYADYTMFYTLLSDLLLYGIQINGVDVSEVENITAITDKHETYNNRTGEIININVTASDDTPGLITVGNEGLDEPRQMLDMADDIMLAYPDAEMTILGGWYEGTGEASQNETVVLAEEADTTTTTEKPLYASLYGDVNLDKTITMLDYVYLCKYNAKLITLNEQQLANADCTANGTINASDELALMRFLIEEVDSLPALRDDE